MLEQFSLMLASRALTESQTLLSAHMCNPVSLIFLSLLPRSLQQTVFFCISNFSISLLLMLRLILLLLVHVCLSSRLIHGTDKMLICFAGETWEEWLGWSSGLGYSLRFWEARPWKPQGWTPIIYWEGNQIRQPVRLNLLDTFLSGCWIFQQEPNQILQIQDHCCNVAGSGGGFVVLSRVGIHHDLIIKSAVRAVNVAEVLDL